MRRGIGSRRSMLAALLALPLPFASRFTSAAGAASSYEKLGYERSQGVQALSNGSERMRATTASGPGASYLRFKMPDGTLKIGEIVNLQATFNSTSPGIPCTPVTPRYVIVTTAGSVIGELSPVVEDDCSDTRTVELVRPGGLTRNFDVSAITGQQEEVTYDQMRQILAPYSVKGISLFVSVPEGEVGEFSWVVKPKVIVNVDTRKRRRRRRHKNKHR